MSSESTDDDEFPAPFQTNNDDDEPPAPPTAGVVLVEKDSSPDVLLAPTAEPKHVANPENSPVVA